MSAAPRSGSVDIVRVVLRVMLGLLFLSVWGSNFHKGLYHPDQYRALIESYISGGDAPGFWKDVMQRVADGANVTARLQLVTELAFGILLALGLATRAVGLAAGIFLSALWVSEIGVPNEWIWSLVFPALAAFAVAILAAGRRLGLDGVLGRRIPRWIAG